MRRTSATLIALAFAVVRVLARPAPARAECPYFVIPPATDAARSAREVIVGTVIENVGDNLFDFRLRIDHVLRGSAHVGDVRRFENLFPGWPLAETGDGTTFAPCEPIPGWKDNAIALSLDALAPDGRTRYSGASWISGNLPINRELPRTTLARMATLAGMPQTDTASTGPVAFAEAPSTDISVPGLLGLFLFVVAVVALRPRVRPNRLRSRSGPSRSSFP